MTKMTKYIYNLEILFCSKEIKHSQLPSYAEGIVFVADEETGEGERVTFKGLVLQAGELSSAKTSENNKTIKS